MTADDTLVILTEDETALVSLALDMACEAWRRNIESCRKIRAANTPGSTNMDGLIAQFERQVVEARNLQERF